MEPLLTMLSLSAEVFGPGHIFASLGPLLSIVPLHTGRARRLTHTRHSVCLSGVSMRGVRIRWEFGYAACSPISGERFRPAQKSAVGFGDRTSKGAGRRRYGRQRSGPRRRAPAISPRVILWAELGGNGRRVRAPSAPDRASTF